MTSRIRRVLAEDANEALAKKANKTSTHSKLPHKDQLFESKVLAKVPIH